MLWGVTYPDQALALIHQLKSQLRQYIVQNEGQRGWSHLVKIFRKKTSNAGYSSDLVNEILEEYRETIIDEYGHVRADEFFGN